MPRQPQDVRRLIRQTLDAYARLARLRAIPVEYRTRREEREVRQAACLPWEKVCAWCLTVQDRRQYGPMAASADGRDAYCYGCRRVRDRLRRPVEEQMVRDEEALDGLIIAHLAPVHLRERL